ncbi:MAG: HAS-barrel domain-containing protein [Herpetosiphon sp.]
MTPIAEILESSTLTFTACTYDMLAAPPFGALVSAETPYGYAVYGLVYAVQSSSREQNGRAVVRGHDGMYDGDIYAANPDLASVLQTEFVALIVGHSSGTTIRQHVPPQPPLIHYSVHLCNDDEIRRFSVRFDFLRTVLGGSDLPADELIGACMQRAARVQPDPQRFLIAAARHLALSLRDDHQRLMALIDQLRPA